jgi:S-adenosylmethionine synthetase
VPGVREVYVWLCSQIGEPIDQPLIASAQLILEPGMELEAIRRDA